MRCELKPPFREINGKSIRWRNSSGVVHACEGNIYERGRFMFWTLCGQDVPPESIRLEEAGMITCPVCAEIDKQHKQEG